jgi:uncharacterized protein (DUF3820 family)
MMKGRRGMIEIFTDESPMPFGQYKNTPLAAIPNDYLLFLYENDKAGRIKPYILHNIDAIRKGSMKERQKRFNKRKR